MAAPPSCQHPKVSLMQRCLWLAQLPVGPWATLSSRKIGSYSPLSHQVSWFLSLYGAWDRAPATRASPAPASSMVKERDRRHRRRQRGGRYLKGGRGDVGGHCWGRGWRCTFGRSCSVPEEVSQRDRGHVWPMLGLGGQRKTSKKGGAVERNRYAQTHHPALPIALPEELGGTEGENKVKTREAEAQEVSGLSWVWGMGTKGIISLSVCLVVFFSSISKSVLKSYVNLPKN